ncbi:MAG: periplasmic heavy metal sensor [Pseudomonadota bacterium]
MPKIHARGALKWGLVVSLALNFMVIGGAVGFALKGKDRVMGSPSTARGAAAPLLRPLLTHMDRSERRALLEGLRMAHQTAGLTHAAAQNTREQLGQALQTTPFDQAGFTAALDQLRLDQTTRIQISHDYILFIITQMTDVQRADLAIQVLEDKGRAHGQRR